MWKRKKTWLLVACIVSAMTFGVLYEHSTRVVRGWLHGEAFFDGRPTSWWREVVRIDLEQPPPSWWSRVWNRMRTPPSSEDDLPSQLITHLDADDVLRELAADEHERIAHFANNLLEAHRVDRASGGDSERQKAGQLRMIFRLLMTPRGPPNVTSFWEVP